MTLYLYARISVCECIRRRLNIVPGRHHGAQVRSPFSCLNHFPALLFCFCLFCGRFCILGESAGSVLKVQESGIPLRRFQNWTFNLRLWFGRFWLEVTLGAPRPARLRRWWRNFQSREGGGLPVFGCVSPTEKVIHSNFN